MPIENFFWKKLLSIVQKTNWAKCNAEKKFPETNAKIPKTESSFLKSFSETTHYDLSMGK